MDHFDRFLWEAHFPQNLGDEPYMSHVLIREERKLSLFRDSVLPGHPWMNIRGGQEVSGLPAQPEDEAEISHSPETFPQKLGVVQPWTFGRP